MFRKHHRSISIAFSPDELLCRGIEIHLKPERKTPENATMQKSGEAMPRQMEPTRLFISQSYRRVSDPSRST